MAGLKNDQGKPPMDLIPYDALVEVAKVLAAGEKKYGLANWSDGIEMRRLIAAAMRHLGQFNNGEDFDEETQTLHLANSICNLMFAIWMYKHRPDLDNRWTKKFKNNIKVEIQNPLDGRLLNAEEAIKIANTFYENAGQTIKVPK